MATRFPRLDEGQTVTMFSLIHVVRGDKDRAPLVGKCVEQVPKLASGDGIDAGGWFV